MTPEKVVIVVNGKSFSNDRQGGAIRAALNIVNSLNDIYGDRDKELEILIPSSKEIPHQKLFESESIRVKFFVSPLYTNTYFKNLWEQFILPLYINRNKKYKLLLNLTNSAPVIIPLSSPQILLIHDIGFLNSQWFARKFSTYLKIVINLATKRNIHFATVSQTSANQIVSNFPVITSPQVIYNGYDKPPVDSIEHKCNFNYIVFIGSINPRKNLKGLLESFFILKSRVKDDLKLLVIGSQKEIFNSQNQNTNLCDRKDIIFTGYIDNKTKWSMLKDAKLLILPSLLEGFGLPILEAFSMGIPVVASDIPVFHELYEDAIEYVNPNSPEDIAKGMQYVLGSKERQKVLIQNGSKIINKFSWLKTAQNYDFFIENVLNSKSI
jgi:glycosyltransferase involved in cell wall biosynthesis